MSSQQGLPVGGPKLIRASMGLPLGAALILTRAATAAAAILLLLPRIEEARQREKVRKRERGRDREIVNVSSDRSSLSKLRSWWWMAFSNKALTRSARASASLLCKASRLPDRRRVQEESPRERRSSSGELLVTCNFQRKKVREIPRENRGRKGV